MGGYPHLRRTRIQPSYKFLSDRPVPEQGDSNTAILSHPYFERKAYLINPRLLIPRTRVNKNTALQG